MFGEDWPNCHVRSVPATISAFLLLLTLSVTTPMGTSNGVHDSVLLHPLFGHTHLIGGRIVSHQQAAVQPAPAPTSHAPAVGAEAGASAAGGVAIAPSLPFQDVRLVHTAGAQVLAFEPLQPRDRVTAPPDPPPTSGV